MALFVEKINADTSFILTFAPTFAPEKNVHRFPGAYTILVDPWLAGHCSMWHPNFQLSHHTTECSYSSLSELLTPPDMILISQDKPDHCHRETLCSMPKKWSTIIVAPSSAARRILSWNYFDPQRVRILEPYRENKSKTVLSHCIPAYTSSSSPGEVTIAYVPDKHDMTGLHNAIGITYRPPGALLATITGQTMHLSDIMHPHEPTSRSRLREIKSEKKLNATFSARQCKDYLPKRDSDELSRPDSANPDPYQDSLLSSKQHTELQDMESRASSPADPRDHQERTLSVIYTPHGVNSSVLKPYVRSHLEQKFANPPVALFHSLNREVNPWFMGGVVVAGAPGGCELVKYLGVKHWFSAHDEVKDTSGIAVTWVKSHRYDANQILQMLGRDDGRQEVEIHVPDVGNTTRICG